MISKKFKSFLKDYFTINSRERKGALVLAGFIVLQIAYISYLNYFKPFHEPALTTHNVKIIEFEKRFNQPSNLKKSKTNTPSSFSTQPIHINFFDPNLISDSVWLTMGLSQKQTAVIRNYINKGGVFRNKEDLSKIYGISSEQFQMLEPFIAIQKKELKSTFSKKEFSKIEFHKVELNSADTVELARLPMIGPGRARIIFRYREALGGFVSVSQLKDVFGIDSLVYAAIESKVSIDKNKIRKTNLNSDELKHPFLSKQQTSIMKAYRKQHGDFKSINDLRHLETINTELIDKLAPYATFE